MKTILCYGDSNTWGLNYKTNGRFVFGERWPNIMQQQLGGDFCVIEEGLNGRTTGQDDPDDEYREAKNGSKYLIPCLRSHSPIDLVIIMLGTNDLKIRFFTSVSQIAKNIEIIVKMTRDELKSFQGYAPKILLVAPMAVGDTIETSAFCEAFGGTKAIAPSKKLAGALYDAAQRCSCYFINAAKIARPNKIDAIHFTREGHKQFGTAVSQTVKKIFSL